MNPQPTDFQEWMVTQALAAYLGQQGMEDPQRMAWLFGLEANTPRGGRKLSDLCGFDWAPRKVFGGAEAWFKEEDRGALSLDQFKKTFWTITPDFRYWIEKRDKQLIIEAKGTPKPSGHKDADQAKRYFMYLKDTGHKGAVVYFVPNPKVWLDWLTKLAEQVARENAAPFGVVDLNVAVVPQVADELVHVVGGALVQTARLLEKALHLSKAA